MIAMIPIVQLFLFVCFLATVSVVFCCLMVSSEARTSSAALKKKKKHVHISFTAIAV